MTPVEQAKAVYDHEPCARSFVTDLELHLLHGWVLSTPKWFMMARAVWSGARHEDIVNPAFNDFSNTDTWHVYLFAGGDLFRATCDARTLASEVTLQSMKWVSFERRNKLRFYLLDALIAKMPWLPRN